MIHWTRLVLLAFIVAAVVTNGVGALSRAEWGRAAVDLLGAVILVAPTLVTRRYLAHPRREPRTRTWCCPVCGNGVEVTGTSKFFPPMVSGSEVATLCTKQNGTTHETRVRDPASPM